MEEFSEGKSAPVDRTGADPPKNVHGQAIIKEGERKFESKLSNFIGRSYTNSSKLDLCMTHGGKNEILYRK